MFLGGHFVRVEPLEVISLQVNFILLVLWQTRQIKSLFNTKTKILTDPKLVTKVIVLVALIALAKL